MSWQSDVLFSGCAQGKVLRLDAPISFWGGVNPESSEIVLAGHPQRGLTIKDSLLVMPQLIGSSSSSAVMLELVYKKVAPAALILGHRDAILPIGVLVAQQMQWPVIPVVVLEDPPFSTGDLLTIGDDGVINRQRSDD